MLKLVKKKLRSHERPYFHGQWGGLSRQVLLYVCWVSKTFIIDLSFRKPRKTLKKTVKTVKNLMKFKGRIPGMCCSLGMQI